MPMQPDLSPHAQLLHLESNPARDQRRLGQLGQTRAHRQRACARVSFRGIALPDRLRADGSSRACGSHRVLATTDCQSSGLFTPMPGLLSTCV